MEVSPTKPKLGDAQSQQRAALRLRQMRRQECTAPRGGSRPALPGMGPAGGAVLRSGTVPHRPLSTTGPHRLAIAARGSTRSRSALVQRGAVIARVGQQQLATGTVVPAGPSGDPLRWGSFVSKLSSLEASIDEAVRNILASIGPDSQPELAIVFVSSVFGPENFDVVVPRLREAVPSLKYVFGCSVSAYPHGVNRGSRSTRTPLGRART